MNIIDEYGALRNALFRLSSKYWRLQKEMSEEARKCQDQETKFRIKMICTIYKNLSREIDELCYDFSSEF